MLYCSSWILHYQDLNTFKISCIRPLSYLGSSHNYIPNNFSANFRHLNNEISRSSFKHPGRELSSSDVNNLSKMKGKVTHGIN
jgi:hypothetical protein